MLDIVFHDNKTGVVNYVVTNVTYIRYITQSEIGVNRVVNQEVVSRDFAFPHTERIEISHTSSSSPWRIALLQSVSHE